MELEAS